ncbi:MAG: hypothetical protein M1820_002174 [Bogoriella megaspora]|nr:MAG: hypothetical protein M1820_002174 [Bogoriella megaspora]
MATQYLQNAMKQLQFDVSEPETLCIDISSSTELDKYPAKQHARRVAQNLDVANGLIYLPGAPKQFLEDSDQFREFRQRRFFYYLSGVDEPDCQLTYDIAEDFLVLYVPETSGRDVIYNGRGSNVVEALDRYDVDNAFYTSDVIKDINKWKAKSEGKIYILHPDQAVKLEDKKDTRVDYSHLRYAIEYARVRKDPYEIQMIKKANEISARAHTNILRNIKHLRNETEVEAIFIRSCMGEGAKHQAYKTIAASGENAATLHYIRNDEPLEGRQLMCLDAGCEWNCYACDVTRTFPLSGAWPSVEAENIYKLVEKMQESCIAKLKPGVRFLDINFLSQRIAIQGLLELGIFHNGTAEEIFDAGTSLAFYPHGLGHHVGLEVHDVSALPITAGAFSKHHLVSNNTCHSLLHADHPVLGEDMVVTVEPGIYFSAYALTTIYFPDPIHSRFIDKEVVKRYLPVGGVRIEDDILITRDGYENLTTAPKGTDMLAEIRGSANQQLKFEEKVDKNEDPLPSAATASLWSEYQTVDS